MRLCVAVIALSTIACVAPAAAAPSPVDILSANHAAMGGHAWDGKAVLKSEFNLSGMGLPGTATSIQDLRDGRSVTRYSMGPISGAQGYDGTDAWNQGATGTITVQKGGDAHELAVNEAYRTAHLWWKPGFSGAAVTGGGQKTADDGRYDVLTVTPQGGKPFEAWFDTKTHLLARTTEKQGPDTVTVTMSGYRPIKGAEIPNKIVIDSGHGAKYLQTAVLTTRTFLPPQPASTYAAPKENLHDYTIAGGAKQAQVPFRLINNHIYADVAVNGKGPLLFIFDTGGHDILTPATAKALGVKVEGAAPGTGAGTKVVNFGFAKVNSLKIGDATFSGQLFGVLDFEPDNVEGVAIEGMVGFDVFKRFVTRIDYGAKTLTLIEPAAFNPGDAGTPVPFVFDGSIPEVKGSFEGLSGEFDIDTGSRAGLTLTKPFAERNNLRATHSKGVDAVDGWGVGGASTAYVTRGKELTLGTIKVPGIVTALATQSKGAFAAASYQGNVGAGILKRYIVTFDYGHQIMYLKPLRGPVADLDTFDRSGMWINAAPNGFEVMDVVANGPAANAGIAKGDILTDVNGKPATSIPVYELRRMLREQAPGTVVAFTVKGAAGAKEMKVTLRDQI
jgi:hypothetical protein